MSHRNILFLSVFILLTGCAQVPQSSVTLSNSISDDVVSMQKAHKSFINYYFDNLETQANELINNKYRPSLIRQIIELDVQKFKTPDKQHQSLFNAIQKAFIDNKNLSQNELNTSQSNAMLGMQIFYSKIDKKVELERKQLIGPLKKQRRQLLGKVDSNYINIVKKNASITALLNSVTDIHETQQRLFEMVGVEDNIRVELGTKLTTFADDIEELQSKVDNGSSKVEDVEAALTKFKNLINQ
jgi:hypothetical protein